jgi:aminoglycoside phosphotransferase family enzyme/predicted kinase
MRTSFNSGLAQATLLVNALRAQLQSPGQQTVELIETHLSWVLLTPQRAYKIKKPVVLPFADFRTLSMRQHFCAEEVRLNQRLAPQLYLGVTPITGSAEAPQLDGQGPAIEYAVCMQRFAAGQLLSEQCAAGQLQQETLDALAIRLARFHTLAPQVSGKSPWGQPETILQAMSNVIKQLDLTEGRQSMEALRQWTNSQVARLHGIWMQRRYNGAVREVHGDLHLSNLVLLDGEPTGFDCIEFEPSLRWIDVMSDIAFLTMDLHAHGRSDLAWRFLDQYLQSTGDYEGLPALGFYEIYRALVRALVSQLPGAQGNARADPLAWAHKRIQPGPARARLLITHGLSGSGKSTLSQQMLRTAGAIRLRSDVERKRLFGLGPLNRPNLTTPELYTPEVSRRTFERLASGAASALAAGYPAIVDAAFLQRSERDDFRRLAAEWQVPFTILHCHAPPQVMRQRIELRQETGQDASDATVQVLDRQLSQSTGLEPDELVHVLDAATDQNLDLSALTTQWLAAT